MRTKLIIISIIIVSILIFLSIQILSYLASSSKLNNISVRRGKEIRRELMQYPVNPNKTQDVSGSILPNFTVDLNGVKFKSILQASKDKLTNFVSASIVRKVDASNDLSVHLEVDSRSKKLFVRPEEVTNFRPGLYKLSLSMRTLEGVVNLEQDFSWGVIAVNTNKSIYEPGEAVKIGMGVLDDAGETQCLTGFNHVTDLRMTITSPEGRSAQYGILDKTIKDSGKCDVTSVTNEADFQASYKTDNPGIYQIEVTAKVKGVERTITDYFKVQEGTAFDVERTSFPTRIYPRSVYPVGLNIVAKNNYIGTVTDVVPSSFLIEGISDGGKAIKDGDFTRIVWDANLTAGKIKSFTYFIHFPLISPEFYLIGPIKIGKFQEARQWQIASDAVNSTSGVVSLEDNGSSNTWSRVWTGTTWNPALGSTPTSMSNTPADSRWFREVSSPKTGEKLVAILDNVNPDDLYVFHWSGTAWAQEIKVDLAVNTADTTRMIDIAYEENSGEALFVYSKGTGTGLYYQSRTVGNSGSWSGEQTVATIATFARWIRLQPQFESDSILLGFLNDNERVGAFIWDGATNTFGSQLSDSAGTLAATSNEQDFDIAWETNTGTPMIFWGTTSTSLIYREFTSGTWQAEANVTTGLTNNPAWVRAAADPRSTSNNIALGIQDGTTCRARFGIWTGSSASFDGTVPTCASAATNNLMDTAFENSTGQAMFVYISSATTNQFSWKSWTSGGGFTSSTTEAGTTTGIEGVQLYSDLNTTSMMLLYHDNSGTSSVCQLWDREWDGSSWSAKNASPVFNNMCASADNDTEPYGFGFDRNLETQVAYRWFANSIDLGGSMTALTSQDTPYTLSTANEAFRLRLLLYYPDSLLTSANRQYKLQYVDPGTGTCDSPSGGTPSTWTDVPTSGGSTISFNNNATLNDGDNIATSSADPSYQSYLRQYQDYEESNNFTNSRTNMSGDQVSLWDFSLIDNTAYDRVAQTYCFRVARSNDLVLRIGIYPQISTAAVDDVLIQGGTDINQGTAINNP